MNTHFFKASSIGIYFTDIVILSVGHPFSHVIKCWCGTIATRFSQVVQRDSHDLPFFPPGCTFSVATTIACCPCHPARVGTFARRQLLKLLRFQLRTVIFRQMRMISFLSSLAVLPTCYLLHDSRLLGLTLCVYLLLSVVATGFPGHARLAFAQEAVRCPPLFFLHLVLLVVALACWPPAACEQYRFKRC